MLPVSTAPGPHHNRGAFEPRYGSPAAMFAALYGPAGPPTYPAPTKGAPPIVTPGICARGWVHMPTKKELTGWTNVGGPPAAWMAAGSDAALLLMQRL